MSDIESSNHSEIIDVNTSKIRNLNLDYFVQKEIYHLKTLDRYFRTKGHDNIGKMISIINKTSNISLRMLDWFAAKYTKKYKNKVIYKLNDEYFSARISYKAQLDSFTKKYFDPFRRRKKFNYHFNKKNTDEFLYTTIGQLNFFMWAFQHGIIEYIEDNYDTLILAMKQSNKEDKKKKEEKKINNANKNPVIKKKIKKVYEKANIVINKKINILSFD